jgi:hypothetical protein
LKASSPFLLIVTVVLPLLAQRAGLADEIAPYVAAVELEQSRNEIVPATFDADGTPRDMFAGRCGGGPCGQTCGCHSQCCDGGGLDYILIGRVNGTYFDVPGEQYFGGGYGFDLAIHTFENWGVVGSLNANHFEQGSQLVGSLGAVRLPDPCGTQWYDPVSLSFYFDQFTDGRIDTLDGSLYLTQFRLQAGYAFSENLEAGFIGSFPMNTADEVNFLFVNFPNSLPVLGRINSSKTYGGYVSGRFDELQWSAMLGHRDSPGTLVVAGNLRRPITDNLAVFAGGSFEPEERNWGSVFGLELNFGRGGRRSQSYAATTYRQPTTASNEIVRAQSPDIRLVNVPPGEFETPDFDLGRFPQGLGDFSGDNVTAPITPPFPFAPAETTVWSRRYLNWNTRPLLVLQPSEMWRGLNVDGLTNPVQNRIQRAAGPLSPRTNGGFGRTDGQDFQ